MIDSTGRIAALQQAQPPATQLSSAEQNAQATRQSAAPGEVNATESVAAVGEARRGPIGPQTVPSSDDLGAAVAELRNSVARFNRSLEFAIDEASERSVVRVIDVDTEEVVRQIPSEAVLALAAQLKELATTGSDPTGLLLDAKV